LKVQEMLQTCAEHAEKPKKEEPAVVGGENAADAEGDVPMAASTSEPAAATSTQPGGSASEPFSSVATQPDAAAPITQPDSPAAAEGEGEGESEESKPETLRHQAVATIGIALIAMGEDVGAEMALRQFQHLVSSTCHVA
jgi:26S proteasome regulatory subunit N1